MPKKRPVLAKLSKPRLHKTVARERLLSLLDDKREYPAIWIAAPPGAGKTTLAANYVDEANAKAVWFQIDAGDSDPATFFYYLKKAIEQASRRKGKPLQLFTPEFLSDIKGFSRRFFRDASLCLPEDVLLVFDNYHELEPQSTVHEGFAAALEEIPVGTNVLVLSRADPPSQLAQALVNQIIATIPWEELKLSQEEARDIAGARGVTDETIIVELQQKTDGWVAGMTLMLERSLTDGEVLAAARPELLETVSDYFAQVIFEKATPEAQNVMLRTALLPYMTPTLVEAVTGDKRSIDHIRALHRRHFFTSRLPGEVDTYQFHTMFHGFLRSRARASLTPQEVQTVHKTAARTLEAHDDLVGAFALHTGAHAWEDAQRLLTGNASELISQGRWRTLEQWCKALPPNLVDANPWINYWLGRSLVWVDPAAAQRILKSAYGAFDLSGNNIGQALSAAGLLEAIFSEYNYQRFYLIDTWVERLSRLLLRDILLPTPEDEIRIYTTLLNSALFRTPNHPFILRWIDRVKSLIEDISDPNLIVLAAFTLLNITRVTSDENSMRLARQLAAPVLSSPELSPRNAASYLVYEGHGHYMFSHYEKAFECYDRADALANDNGLIGVLQQTAYLRVFCARRANLSDLAKEAAECFSILKEQERVAGPASIEYLRAVIAFDEGDYSTAASRARAACKEIQSEGDYFARMMIGVVCANVLVGSGEPKEAKKVLEIERHKVQGPNTSHHLGVIALNEAWAEHLLGAAEKRDTLLREALERADDERWRLRFHWFTNALEDLLPVAIERAIESELAQQLAHDLKITPKDNNVENWPWPIKIYTLGEFKLLIDGQPPSYSRKMPKKALAILKATVAFGGQNVPEQRLIDALWPDLDGDAAQRALSATVHRLRKLLGYPEAMRQSGGALTLDERVCWVDAFAFESRIAGNCDAAGLEQVIQRYRGAFLPNEIDSPWLAPFREHLKSKFIDVVSKLGAHLEEDKQFAEAMTLYTRGIEADNLIESFYQGLMRCHQQLGQPSEALSTYRRLRDILSISLAVEPSARSQQMADSIRQQ